MSTTSFSYIDAAIKLVEADPSDAPWAAEVIAACSSNLRQPDVIRADSLVRCGSPSADLAKIGHTKEIRSALGLTLEDLGLATRDGTMTLDVDVDLADTVLQERFDSVKRAREVQHSTGIGR